MTIFLIICAAIGSGVGVFIWIDNKRDEHPKIKNTSTPPKTEPNPTEEIKEHPKTEKIQYKTQQELQKDKGYQFEQFIVGLFNKEWFQVVEWRSDKRAHNGMFAENSKYPDMEVEFRQDFDRYAFAVECKWRKSFYNGEVRWAEPYQIDNYWDFQEERDIPVFVAIGIGGTPDNPEQLYVAPLAAVANYPNLFEGYLQKFRRYPKSKFFYNTEEITLT